MEQAILIAPLCLKPMAIRGRRWGSNAVVRSILAGTSGATPGHARVALLEIALLAFCLVTTEGLLDVFQRQLALLFGNPFGFDAVAGRLGYPNRSPYCANAILPGTVGGARLERVFEGRALASGKPVEEIRKEAMARQSLQRMVDPKDIAALAGFLASDVAKSISSQMIRTRVEHVEMPAQLAQAWANCVLGCRSFDDTLFRHAACGVSGRSAEDLA